MVLSDELDLLNDIKAIADEQSQTDPTFKTTHLYARISAKEVRKQLIPQKDYTDDELPSEETIRVKLNALGHHLRSVKSAALKRRYPKRMISSNNCTSCTQKLMKITQYCAFLWMPKRQCSLDTCLEVEKHASLSEPWTTIWNLTTS